MATSRQPAPEPAPTRWDQAELPNSWPDELSAGRVRIFWRLVTSLFARKHPLVELPEDLPGRAHIPKYVLQSFHGLPNGNYSKRVTEGYSRWFDRVMLGVMSDRRRWIADVMQDRRAVLDIGCGAGQVAGLLAEDGARDVWGLDPSPYLLQHAQRSFPSLQLVQGVAEHAPFPDARFDGITACFVFHELPPKKIDAALGECHRLLRPGGKLCIVEPSPEQLHAETKQLYADHGWRGPYFRTLARVVHEPFVESFHKLDKPALLRAHGFELVETRSDFPTQAWLAHR